jgi:hypothetical protein
MLEAARQEWHSFRDDEPGQRFRHHHRRAHESKSKAKTVARIVVGLVLCLGGIVLLFIPGPGLLVILFGMALFAGESKWLATRLDRAEVWTRARWRRFRKKS